MTYRYRTIKVNGKTKLKHRHLMEQKLGRSLLPHEEVHHRDDNYLNNDLDNLVLLTKAAHRDLHGSRRLQHPRVKSCVVCGAEFTPHPTKRKRKVTCSAPCANVQRSRSEKKTKAGSVKPLDAQPLPLFAAE